MPPFGKRDVRLRSTVCGILSFWGLQIDLFLVYPGFPVTLLIIQTIRAESIRAVFHFNLKTEKPLTADAIEGFLLFFCCKTRLLLNHLEHLGILTFQHFDQIDSCAPLAGFQLNLLGI